MSDRERAGDETIAFSSRGGGGPPTSTMPMYVSSSEPPSRGRQVLIYLLVFVLGLGGGFVAAQFVGQDDDRVPDEDLVFFESASTTFPIEGAQFTRSTYNAQNEQCDKEALKQYLRADPRRFRAWLDLQGITESQFDGFVDRLETRILTEPTAVTNHGCFAEGEGPCPFAIQSVLGSGTPVWFDPTQNRVVAKCPCSNPIKAPKCPPNCEDSPTPEPSPSPTPTQSATPTPTRSAPPTATASPTASPTATPSPSPSPTPSPQPVP